MIEQTLPMEQTFQFVLTTTQANTVLRGLSKLTIEEGLGLFIEFKRQASVQPSPDSKNVEKDTPIKSVPVPTA